jgi:adenylate cyclase
VVGYSRLMGRDEAGTLARLQALRREVLEPQLAEHRGRLVKLVGDGVLAEFASVVDAVGCAVAIQRAVAAREAGPEADRLRLRIGINLGDVIVEDDDIYGDGVNVAARLEALAEPGGICLTGDAYSQVRNRLEVAFEDQGLRSVKNIAEPVRVVRVLLDGAGAAPAPALELPDRPSIVVLPFANMSGDPEQDYFSDGISEDLITDLSKIKGLFVIARNSAFAYRGMSVDVRRVGRELGVRWVLEGSVRKAGNRVRITAQLIDGQSGGHLWADRYDGDLTDIFALQDEVTSRIVRSLEVHLGGDERRGLGRRGTDSIEAYDLALRGREEALRHSREAYERARPLFEQALVIDPAYPLPYCGLALLEVGNHANGWHDPADRPLVRAEELARKALALDPDGARARYTLGVVELWKGAHEAARRLAERAIELDPNDATAHGLLCGILHYQGEPVAALASLATAMRLDPRYPDLYLHFRAQNLFMLGRFEEAAADLRERIARNPTTDISRMLLAASYGCLDRPGEARAVWAELLEVSPGFSAAQRRAVLPYRDPAHFDAILDGLRRAGIAVQPPEGVA